MRRETVVESRDSEIELSDEERRALTTLGRQLVSTKQWWGDSEPPVDRSVVQLASLGGHRYRVRVVDAIGLLSIPGLQIEVQPKIPLPHVLFLFGLSGRFPLLDDQRASAATHMALWPLLARWYLDEAERVMRRDLMKGYTEVVGVLPVVRGQVDVETTAQAFYAGRLDMHCRYEEFTPDMPLNRVLRAAAQTIAGSPRIDSADRRRSMRVLARMDDVGELRAPDLRARPGRTTAHYRDAVSLAHHLLLGRGRSPQHGSSYAQSFLIRTPEMIEDGLRVLLQSELADWSITKHGRQIAGTSMTFNPDLVIAGGRAVADVKYKLTMSEWRRADLYQLVAFSAAFHARGGALIGFAEPGQAPPPSIRVGEFDLAHLDWPADPTVAPTHAASAFCASVRSWLNNGAIVTGAAAWAS